MLLRIFNFLLILLISSFFLLLPVNSIGKKKKENAVTAKIKKNLKPYVGKILICVLHDQKIAKGELITFDSKSIIIRNKYGQFPLPLELIKEILIIKESPVIPGVAAVKSRKVEKLPDSESIEKTPTPDMSQLPSQPEVPLLPKLRLEIGGLTGFFDTAYFDKVIRYPWPGSTSNYLLSPSGGKATIDYFFDYTNIMFFRADVQYFIFQSQVLPGDNSGLFLDKVTGNGSFTDVTFGFVFESKASLLSVASILYHRAPGNKYLRWLNFIFPEGQFMIVSRNSVLKHGNSFAQVQVGQDTWGAGLEIGISADLLKLLKGLILRMHTAHQIQHGYTSVNADATDQLTYILNFQSGLKYTFLKNYSVAFDYRYQNEKYYYRKLILSDPPFEPGTSQSSHMFYLSAGYVLY